METVLLAAGTSSRMGHIAKQLLPFGEYPLIVHTVEVALQASDKVILVTGYQADSIEAALEHILKTQEKRIVVVRNTQYRQGQFSSTLAGVSQVSHGVDFFISVADLPLIEVFHYQELAYRLGTHDAVRPHHNGQPGHPVVFSHRMREKILNLPIDAKMHEFVSKIDVDNWEHEDNAWVSDIDTPQDYQRILNLLKLYE